MENQKVVEVFGKFGAEINGNIVIFETEAEALEAVVMEEQSAGMIARADAYCEAKELEGKNAVAKKKVIMAFLAFEATQVLPVE